MASFRKGEQPTSQATSLGPINLSHRKCISNLTPPIKDKVYSFPVVPNWQEKTGSNQSGPSGSEKGLHTAQQYGSEVTIVFTSLGLGLLLAWTEASIHGDAYYLL
jgi:hypothetical protein